MLKNQLIIILAGILCGTSFSQAKLSEKISEDSMDSSHFEVRVHEGSDHIFEYYIEDDGEAVDFEIEIFDSQEEASLWYFENASQLYAGGPVAQRRSCNHPQSGKASWYGPGFHGKAVACQRNQLPKGKRHLHIFDQNALTAAHKTIRCGSTVRVTYKGRSVIVMITDAGPYSKGRVIDLSSAAADQLGLKKAGVGHVQLQLVTCDGKSVLPVNPPRPLPRPEFLNNQSSVEEMGP